MIVSYKIMEEFYLKKNNKIKANNYGAKAQLVLERIG